MTLFFCFFFFYLLDGLMFSFLVSKINFECFVCSPPPPVGGAAELGLALGLEDFKFLGVFFFVFCFAETCFLLLLLFVQPNKL